MLCGVQMMPPACFPVRSGWIDALSDPSQPLAGRHVLLVASCLPAPTILHPAHSYQARGKIISDNGDIEFAGVFLPPELGANHPAQSRNSSHNAYIY